MRERSEVMILWCIIGACGICCLTAAIVLLLTGDGEGGYKMLVLGLLALIAANTGDSKEGE